MDKFPRMFIISSVIYLLIGTLIGVTMASHALNPMFRFIHIHLNLFGFMAMMVFGVAYHILPRFMGKALKYPKLVPVHYFAANIGLIGMMITYAAGGYIDIDSKMASGLFAMFAGFSTLAVMIFAFNLIPIMIMTEKKKPITVAPTPASSESKPSDVTFTGAMKIGEILEKRPETLSVLINAGFKALSDPEKRKTMGDKLVLKTACQIRGVNLDELLTKLNGPISEEDAKVELAAASAPEVPAQQLSLKRGDMVKLDTPVGHMIQVYPETRKVLEDNYGGECFSCPGMAIETVKQTADMHSKDPEEILAQCNALVEEALKG
jgi:cytochrome c oxidase cbb3-type subunit 1